MEWGGLSNLVSNEQARFFAFTASSADARQPAHPWKIVK
jgi:hypothetical protein